MARITAPTQPTSFEPSSWTSVISNALSTSLKPQSLPSSVGALLSTQNSLLYIEENLILAKVTYLKRGSFAAHRMGLELSLQSRNSSSTPITSLSY